MVSFSKIIIVVACSIVLGLSVFGATQATGSMGHEPCADRKGGLPNLVMCETGKSGMHSSSTQARASMKHDPCADRKGGLPNLVMCDEKMRQGIDTSKDGMHSNASQVTGRMRHDPCADRKGGEPNLVACSEELRKGIETIKGEVLRVEGANYVVERFDGKEVQLHIDKDTKLSGKVSQGDRIEAKVGEVNNQKHVLSLRRLE